MGQSGDSKAVVTLQHGGLSIDSSCCVR
jgi:hypothetical protein